MKTITVHWPLAAALVLFLALQGMLGRAAVDAAGGRLVYALDDTYIEMAIGKHLAAHGVWGVTRYEFSGAGSSLAWPLLLAAVNRGVGLDDRTPLVLNLLAAMAVLSLAYAMLRRYRVSRAAQATVLTLLIVAAPLPVLTLIGMEHTLQAFAALALAAAAVRLSAGSADHERIRLLRWTAAAAAATVAIRYDTASVLAMVILVVAVARGWRMAALIALCGAVPVTIYAVVARLHGWPMAPSPVLMKQRLAAVDIFTWPGAADAAGAGLLGILLTEPALLMLVLAALAQLARSGVPADDEREPERRLLLVVFIGAALIHAQFGRVGWRLYRYEAYLIVLGIVANVAASGGTLPEARRWRRGAMSSAAAAGLAILMVFPLVQRGLRGCRAVIEETRDLYRHKYQVGRFFHRYSPAGAVLTTDIGILGYYSDAPMVDAGGLATLELIAMLRGPVYDEALVLRTARQRGVEVSIRENPLGAWPCVAEWQASDAGDAGERIVLYAADAAAARRLEGALRAFAAEDAAHLNTLTFARELARPCVPRP